MDPKQKAIFLSNRKLFFFLILLEANNLKSKRKNLNFHFLKPKPERGGMGKTKEEESTIREQEGLEQGESGKTKERKL
jgi:hypothetical protein